MLEKRWHQGKKQRLRLKKITIITTFLLPHLQTSPIQGNLIACSCRLEEQRFIYGQTTTVQCEAGNYRHEAPHSTAVDFLSTTTATHNTAKCLSELNNLVILRVTIKAKDILSLVPSQNHHNHHYNHNHNKLMTTLELEPNPSRDNYLLLIVIVPYHHYASLRLLSPLLPPSLRPLASLLVLLLQAIYEPIIGSKCKHYCRASYTWLRKSSQHIIIGCHHSNHHYNQNYHRPCYCCIDEINHQKSTIKGSNYQQSQYNFNPNRDSLNIPQKDHLCMSFPFLLMLLLLLLLLLIVWLILLLRSNPFDCYSPNQISTHLSILNDEVNDGLQQSHNTKTSSLLTLSSSSSSSKSSSLSSIRLTRIRTIDEPLDNKNGVGMSEITKLGQQLPKSTNHSHLTQCTLCNSSNGNRKLLEDGCCSLTTLQQVTIPFVACCLMTALIQGNRRWSIIHFSSSPSSSSNHDKLATISNFALDGSQDLFVVEFSQIKLTRYNPSIVTLWADAKNDHFIIVRLQSNFPTSFDYQAKLHLLLQPTSTCNKNCSRDAHSVMLSGTPKIKKQFDWHQPQSTKSNYQRITRHNLSTNKLNLLFHSSSKSSSYQSKLGRARLCNSSNGSSSIDLIDRYEKRNNFRCVIGNQLFSIPRERIRSKKTSFNCLIVNFASIWLTWNILTYMCVNNKHNSQDRLVKLCSCSPIRQNRSSYSLYSTLKNINTKLSDSGLELNTRKRRMDIPSQKENSSYKEYLVTDMCQWKSNLFVPTNNDVYFSSYEYDPARRVAMYRQLLDMADRVYQSRYDSSMMHGRIFSPPTTSPSIVLKIPTKMSKTFSGYEQACGINLIAPTGFRILAKIHGRQSEIRQDEDDDRGLFNVSYLEGKETHQMVAESRGNMMSFRFLLDRDNYQRDANLRFHVVATAFTTTTNEDFARQPKRSSMFNCDHERLIDKSLVCDNFTNCEDGSDEDRSNCFLNPALDSYDPPQVIELYPGQTKVAGDLDGHQTPLSKSSSDQHQSATNWTSYIYATLKLIVLLLLLVLLTLFCVALVLIYRKRLRERQNSIASPVPSRPGSTTSILKKQRNRFQDSAVKGSIFSFNRPPQSPRLQANVVSDLSTNPAVASSTTSMLPERSGGVSNRPATLSSSANSTLTRPVPAKRVTKSPNQTLRPPPVDQLQQQQQQRLYLQPVQQQPSKQYLSVKEAGQTGMDRVTKPPGALTNISYYHHTSMTRSFETPSPGGSILVPSETMRTVYLQTDKKPSYQSGKLPPSSQI